MNFYTPKHSKEELNQRYTLVITEYEHIIIFSKNILDMVQSVLIHIYNENLTEEEFSSIHDRLIKVLNDGTEQTTEYLKNKENNLTKGEREAITSKLSNFSFFFDNFLSGTYEQAKSNARFYLEQPELLKNALNKIVDSWKPLKILMERVVENILPKHNNSKRKEQLYLTVANMLAIFIDELVKRDYKELFNLAKQLLIDLDMEEFLPELTASFKEFQKVKLEAFNYKTMLEQDFEDLTEQNPYACYTEKEYLKALRQFKKTENLYVGKSLLMSLLEFLYSMTTINGLTTVMPEQMVNAFIIIFTQMGVYSFDYLNKIDEFLSLKEFEHEIIDKHYQEYLEKKKKEKQITLEQI